MKEKFVNYVLSQVGYKEGYNNDNKYGKYFNLNNEPWCCLFISYCARMTNIPTNIIPTFAECGNGYNFFKERNEIYNYPEYGDIVFFKPTIKGAISSHVGVVVEVNDNYIKTVEGNASNNTDGVYKMTYRKDYNKFLGFGRPAYTSDSKINAIYQTYDNKTKCWLPSIKNYNNIDSNGYAGIIGDSMGGLRVKLSNGEKVYIKSHIKNNGWLSEIHEWNNTNNGYSGIKGRDIDAVMLKSNVKLLYRVHLLKQKRWLGWVDGYNENDSRNGYAGNLGQIIDAIQIKIV